MSINGLEKLDVWCKARDFAVHVRKVSKERMNQAQIMLFVT